MSSLTSGCGPREPVPGHGEPLPFAVSAFPQSHGDKRIVHTDRRVALTAQHLDEIPENVEGKSIESGRTTIRPNHACPASVRSHRDPVQVVDAPFNGALLPFDGVAIEPRCQPAQTQLHAHLTLPEVRKARGLAPPPEAVVLVAFYN